MKLQQEEDLSAGGGAGPVPSQSSLRQPKATASAASNIDKPEKKSDNVSCATAAVVCANSHSVLSCSCVIIIIITDLYRAFRSEDTEAL